MIKPHLLCVGRWILGNVFLIHMGSRNAILKNSPHNTQDLLFSSNIFYLACPIRSNQNGTKKIKILFLIQMAQV